MTTTTNSNPSKIQPPEALSLTNAGDTNPGAIVEIYFRQSADGVNFTVTPVYLRPQDATAAINGHPAEYSQDGATWAAWPNAYNNSSQPVGGRGALRGACVAVG